MTKKAIAGFAVAIILALLFYIGVQIDTANPHSVTGTVIEKYVKRVIGGKYARDDFHVVVRCEDGSIQVVQVRDCPIKWQFDSANTYARLTVGQTVHLTIAGYRCTLLSMFPRVERVD